MLPSFSVRKPFTIIVAVVLVLVLGGTSATKMSTSLIPEINLPYAVIITTYPGASPEEVEKELTTPIEGALAATSGVDFISSTSSENMSLVAIRFVDGTNMDSVMIEMRETLDLFTDYLPEEAGTPMISKVDMNALPIAVLTVNLADADRAEVSSYVTENIVTAYESVEGVANVSTRGMVETQVNVIVRQDEIDKVNDELSQLEVYASLMSGGSEELTDDQIIALMGGDTSALMEMSGSAADDVEGESYLSSSTVARILKAQNFSYPNGYITEDGVDYLVRTGDEFADIEELGDTLILSIPDADIEVRLSDIADIAVVDNADDTYTKVNGKDAVVLTVQKQSEFSTVDVAHSVADKTAELEAEDGDLSVTTLMDQGVYVDMVVDTVVSNLLYGALLAIIVIILFLKSWKLTGVIALSIPLSLVIALILMYFSGITLNMLSLSGLALGVGMLVDNSIVVIENIYRKRMEGSGVKEAAIQGTKQVSGAIVASTITTCAVFVPFAFETGITQQLFSDLALTICYSLLGSLVVALSFVPMMCSGALRNTVEKPNRLFDSFQSWYGRVLVQSLRHKAIPLTVVTLLFAFAAFAATQIGTEYFPETNSSQITSTVTFEDGLTFEEKTEALEEVTVLIEGVDGVEAVGVTMGDSGGSSLFGSGSFMSDDGNSVSAYLILDSDRATTSMEIAREIDSRSKAAGFDVTTTASSMDISMLTGSGIEVHIYGDDLDLLRETAADVSARITLVEGTTDVDDGFDEGSPEVRVIVDKDAAMQKGLTVSQVYSAINGIFGDTDVTTTISEDGTDYPVVVSTDTDTQPVLQDLNELSIHSDQLDQDVPLSDIATIVDAQGYTSISHEGQRRVVTVTTAIADGYNVGKVGAAVEDTLADFDVPKGSEIVIAGENESINEALEGLTKVILLAILFVYLVMVAQFQSLRHPL
ncbi:MAG: efflux RND transporter permease subunit, partial [Actinobacteria bacterium]|nr:efflux RND transporter permease subunit [Actinomycetota bacterium]